MNVYLGMPLVQSFFSLVLIVLVLKGHLHRTLHRLFALFLSSLFAWGLLIFAMRDSPDTGRALFWEHWLAPLGLFTAAVFYHFTLRYTFTRIKSWILPVLYLLPLIFLPLSALTNLVYAGMQRESYGYAPVLGILAPFQVTASYVLPVLSLFILKRHYQGSISPVERNRYLYIMAGLILSLVGGIFDLLPLLGLPLYPGFIIGNMLFCLLTAVAILKYNLLNIQILWRQSQVYLLASLGAFLPFLGIFYLLMYFSVADHFHLWQDLALVFAMTLAAVPLWRYLQNRIDRWFSQDKYHYLEALANFSRETHHLTELSRLNNSLVVSLSQALKSRNIFLVQPVSPESDFVPVASSGEAMGFMTLKSHSPLIEWLKNSPGPLFLRDIDLIPQLKGIVWEEKRLLEICGAELLVPLKTSAGNLSGVIIISPKLTGQPYNLEDFQLLQTFGRQIALALENNRLYHHLVNTRNKLETWLNSMTDYILVVGANYTVQFMNQTARKVSPIHDRSCWEILEQPEPCSDCPLNTQLSGKAEGLSRIVRIGNREYEATTYRVAEPDHSFSMIEILRDVTERTRLQQAVITARAQVEASRSSDRLKTEFLSMVSHELRTPLTLIKGYLSLLQSPLPPSREQQREAFQTLDQESDKLVRLVADLLDMSRIEAGTLRLQKDDYQVSEILEDSEKLLSLVTRDHHLEILMPQDLPPVRVDRMRIGQVLVNLCDNAAKYTPCGSRITIEACQRDGEVIVSVADQGNGIPAEIRNKLFKPFGRVESQPSRRKGLGLGLAICRGIIEAHQGRIWVDSQNETGAKFSFSLPVVTGKTPGENVPEQEQGE